MPLLSKDQILAAPIPHVEVDVPEWGGSVRLRLYSARSRVEFFDVLLTAEREQIEWEKSGEAAGLPKPRRYDEDMLTLLFAMVDEQGRRLFEIEDYDTFEELGYETQARLATAFHQLRVAQVTPAVQKKGRGSTRRGASSTA